MKNLTNKMTGLSYEQVQQLPKNNFRNTKTKPYSKIITEHIFTWFNGINFGLAILVLYTGSYKNMLFLGVVITNMILGMVQEIRSKKILDKISIIHQPLASVLREGKEAKIPMEDIVLHDIVLLRSGDQVSVDGICVEGNIECDESALSGESCSVEKNSQDSILSGSFVISGQAKMQVTQVGEDTYVHSILKEAKRTKRYPSQLRDAIQSIIKISSIILLPIGTLLFLKTYFVSHQSLSETILSIVAAVIGMIPEGLVILTSIALSVGSIKLAKKHVLVQELYCIETLARVDTLCCDKTGTITQGKMKVVHMDCYRNDEKTNRKILAAMYQALPDNNSTATAIRIFAKVAPQKKVLKITPFSSLHKYSSVTFEEGTYYAGAYSFICETVDSEIQKQIETYAEQGMRVIALMKDKTELLALLCIQDVLRSNIRSIFEYFQKQDVDIKIISGDDAKTVAAIAKKAGIEGNYIDMSQTDIQNFDTLVETYSIFGRVKPEQKKQMVQALKKNGHTVAMTGDGVNDVMALKEADCSIAMGSGAQAAQNIASLILLRDQFTALPSILKEGRCVINNIQRTASLFLVKTLFSVGLSFLTLFWLQQYPFDPIQLTLISSLATGIPSFVLTLEPDERRVEGDFIKNVFCKALPGAFCVVISVWITSLFVPVFSMNHAEFSTICTILAGVNALWVLVRVCLPFTRLRKMMVFCMAGFFVFSIVFLGKWFSLVRLSILLTLYTIVAVLFIPHILRRMFYLNWRSFVAFFDFKKSA